MPIILGDRHHLDDLVVLWSLVILGGDCERPTHGVNNCG